MELNISNIKNLTSIPREYISNSQVIEYLYQNNPNIFEIVNEDLNLSFELMDKITQLINNGTIVLTEKNVKLLDSLYSEDVIDILNNHFDYLYFINKDNFNGIGVVRDSNFVELLEKNNVKITDKSPYLVTLCSDYIIKQYIENKVDIKTILPYFVNWYNYSQRDLIQEYFKKGEYNLSIFYDRDVDNGRVSPFFENISIKMNGNSADIKSNNIKSLISLLNFDLPFSISNIFLSDNKSNDTDILYLLEKINEKDICLNVQNGLSISSNLQNNYKFLELCGNVGIIELSPFNLEEFNELLQKAQEHPGVILNVKLDDFMDNQNYFLTLNSRMPINIFSQNNVSILSLNEMKELNIRLDHIIAETKNSNLSPYEKYISAYNIVKSFKKYKFYLDNKEIDELISDQSRNPYLVLINQYIVCAGYTSLLHLLLEKLDIPSHEWTLDVSEKSEAVISGDFKNNDAHARLYVNIVDNKYGINGYYMCDPTFDNVEKENSELYGYKYLSMSCGESHDYGKTSPSYYYFSRDFDVFNDQMFINTDNYLSKAKSLDEIFTILKDLDPNFYFKLSKIKNIEEQKALIQKHFKEKTYRSISLEKKYSAIISVLEFQNKVKYSDIEKKFIRENLYNIDYDIGAIITGPIVTEEDFEDWEETEDDVISVNKKR